jgi:hypothetical protein
MEFGFLATPPMESGAAIPLEERMSLMNRATALCLAAVCFLSAGSAAHADHITYHFKTTYPSISVDHGLDGIRVTGSGTLPTSGTITANVTAFSFTFPNSHDNVSVPIDLTLTDQQTHQSKTLLLGTLSGSLSVHGSKLDFHSAGLQTVTFGTSTYKISFLSDTIHSQGRFYTQGQLKFTVSDPSSGAPEPSSFVLAGIGVPLLGVFLRRRRA